MIMRMSVLCLQKAMIHEDEDEARLETLQNSMFHIPGFSRLFW